MNIHQLSIRPHKHTLLLAALAAAVLLTSFSRFATAQMALTGFDTSTQPGGTNNFGNSPLAASVTTANLTTGGLTRGSGVGTTGTGAARGFGGTTFNSTTAAGAVTANQYLTFTLTPASGYSLSLNSFDQFSYRRSSTGATSGSLDYSLDGTNFTNITTLSFASTASTGASVAPIDLSGVSGLQNVINQTVTFRIAPFGASGATGTFYIYDFGNSTAADLDLTGTLTASPVPEPATLLGGALLVGAAGWTQRRRLRDLAKSPQDTRAV